MHAYWPIFGQDGHFDHADRLFHSLAETWAHLVEAGNTSDIKELIPEAYYMPELFTNRNDFNLGTRQDGVTLHLALRTSHFYLHLHHYA